jgi:AbrB family looped-hinge helix DNA binding protein
MVMVELNGMKDLVPIDKAGRVVLPKEVREQLALNPGDLLKVSIQGNELTLRPQKGKAGLVKRGRALVFSVGTNDVLSPEVVDALIEQGRAERDLHVMGPVRGASKRR